MQNIINGLPIAAVILLLAVGFAFLVKGADFFVEGSSSTVSYTHLLTGRNWLIILE